MLVDTICNELGITIPVAVHADHYGIRNEKDLAAAKLEIPTLFEAGMTSVAIDASHLPDDKNLLANIAINPSIPKWAGLETEVGEIKGEEGLSTVEEALFLIRGLNAHDIFPDWIALNNGTTHGIEEKDSGIHVQLTSDIHKAIEKYKVSGAQHGTSGNSSERLRQIAAKTHTTKANVATALQMISWGVQVNDYGNAILDADGNFSKLKGEGVSEEMWTEMAAYAQSKSWKKGDYKNLNLPFENKLLAQPREIRDRVVKGVEDFSYKMMTEVFNSQDTAPLAFEAILKAGSYDLGPKVTRMENPVEWTESKITERASRLGSDKGAAGKFDD
jgi:fructose-bisphosphate aldolase class II